jgi:hypothetical protein
MRGQSAPSLAFLGLNLRKFFSIIYYSFAEVCLVAHLYMNASFSAARRTM